MKYKSRSTALTLCIALVGAGAMVAQATPQYTVTDLSSPTNTKYDIINGINNAGHVPRSTISAVNNLNDLDQLVGSASYSTTDYGHHASVEKNGAITLLGTLGGRNSAATAINNHGQIVGTSEMVQNYQYPYHAFLYSNGVMTDLGTLGGSDVSASDINDNGQIVGTSITTTTLPMHYHAFSYINGVMTDLGTLPGTFDSFATAINNAGVIVGTSGHAVRWDHGVITDLGTLAGANATATGLNDQGDIVGTSNSSTPGPAHGFLIHNGVMTDVNTLIDSTLGLTIIRANDINNSGIIVGTSIKTGQADGPPQDSVLLTPNVTIVGAPGKPMGVTATAIDPNHIALKWNPVPGATGYWIYRSEAAGQFHRYCGSVGYITNFTDSALPQDKTYYYVVVAVNGTIAGPPSDEVSAKTPRLPGASSNLTASALAPRLIQLTWSPAVATTYYKVFWRAAGTSFFVYIGSSLSTSFTDDGRDSLLSAGASYEYLVIPANDSGNGGRTNIASVTSPQLGPPPTVTATATDRTTIQLKLTTTNNQFAFNYYMATSATGPFVNINQGSTGIGKTVDGLTPGTTYYFQVSAITSFGEGARSTTVSASTPSTPNVPANFTATPISKTQVNLAWTAPAGATNYVIYRSTTPGTGRTIIGNTTGTTFSDTHAQPATQYYYVVVAGNANGWTKSPEVGAFTLGLPGIPGFFDGMAVSKSQINLSWQAASDATVYVIYRSTTHLTGRVIIGSTTGLSFSDTNLQPSTRYYYTIVAGNQYGWTKGDEIWLSTLAP